MLPHNVGMAVYSIIVFTVVEATAICNHRLHPKGCRLHPYDNAQTL